MMQKLLLISFLVAAAFLFSQTIAASDSSVVGCYYDSNAYSRAGEGVFYASHIDPKLCTHLYYGYFGLSEDGSAISVNKDKDRLYSKTYGGIYDALNLKNSNDKLKVLLSVGGDNVSSDLFSSMAASFDKRQKFVDSLINIVTYHKFDGVDLNWQFPSKDDSKNFSQLLKELNGGLKEISKLLTVTVASSAFVAMQSTPSYSSVEVNAHCDLINVMAYNFASVEDTVASINAPLKGTGAKKVDYAIGTWIPGALNSKVVLGLSLNGRSYTLANSANNKPGDAVTGPGQPGPYRQEAGVLSYNEICEYLKGGWTRNWDTPSSTPYAYNGDQWVSYDDTESLAQKIALIKAKKLAGAYVYSLDSDDFHGKCGAKYPLLTSIYHGLNGKSVIDSIKNLFG